jgi:hypothetical protein
MGESLSPAGDPPGADLIRRFALFRDPQADVAAVLDERETRTLHRLQGEKHFGLIVSQTRSVELTASLKVLAIPGKHGVFLLISTTRADGRPDIFGGGAPLDAVVNGDPVLTSGATIFGLAPDGVTDQPVALSDGSTITAPVLRNVYTTVDPTWSPPTFSDA